MVIGDFAFEEVLLFADVHHLGEPGERIGDTGVDGRQTATGEAAVGDEVDVGLELFGAEADGIDGEAVADEFFFEGDGFAHGVDEFFAELGGPDFLVLFNEIHEQVAEDFDVVGLVPEGVAEHLADAGELVLAIEAEDHAKKAVELGAFHALAENEDVFGEDLFVFDLGEVEGAAKRVRVAGDELVLADDGRDLLEHGLALVRVDAEAGDHVKEAVRMDVFFVGVAAEDELQFGGGDELPDDVLDVVSDDAFGGGEIADGHHDDPTFILGNVIGAPLFDVFLHLNVLGFPVIGLHDAVDIVGPLILQGEEIEGHGLATIDDAFGGKSGFGFVLVENELAGSDGVGFVHDDFVTELRGFKRISRKNWERPRT